MIEKKQQKKYYYSSGGQKLGPVSGQQLKELANNGHIKPTDLIWAEGSEKSTPAGRVKGLFVTITNETTTASEAVADVSYGSEGKVPPESNQFKYWAFISYSSKDAATAKKLHRHLETYRIPRELAGRPGRDVAVPQKLFPIFRDRDELPLSSDLGATIEDALRASRYLIVLCSANAAASRWVNEEVRYFKSLGRADRILAVIVDGVPNGSDQSDTVDKECFPPALRYRVNGGGQLTDERIEPIAGDLRKGGDGWISVLLKAVAGITGMGYDAFAKREATRAFRRRLVYAFACVLLLCAGIAYWDYSRLKVAYFAALGERWGVPVGLAPLSDGQRTGREVSFRFESRGYKVRRVERINGANQLIDDAENGASRINVVYREDGSLERLLLLDHNGKLIVQKSFSKLGEVDEQGLRPCTISFLSKLEFAQTLRTEAAALTTDSNRNTDTRRSDITAFQASYDHQGRLVTVFFRNSYGTPVSDSNGVFGQKYEYNARGMIAKVTNLDSSGAPMADRRGVLSVRKEYGDLATLVRQSFVDADDQPTLGAEQVAFFTYRHDALGNRLECRCFDQREQPTLHKDGYHRAEWNYAPNGAEAGVRYFDQDGKPTLIREGYFEYHSDHDILGRTIRRTFHGVDGELTTTRSGYSSWSAVFDAKGNAIEQAYFDLTGLPVVTVEVGMSRGTHMLDERGNLIEFRLFGVDGHPVLSKGGISGCRQKFDSRDFCIERSFIGIDGESCVNPEGYSTVRFTFDERGNQIEEAYFSLDMMPVVSAAGIASMKDRFDDHGNRVEREFFGINGEPVSHRDGYARFTQTFDDQGHHVETAYFDTAGLPTLSKEGYAKRRVAYDGKGFETRRDFFGTDGRPIVNQKGYARVAYVNDGFGNRVEERYFDTNYLPVADANDISIIKTERDRRGNITSMRTFGPTGRAVLHKKQEIARLDTTYDERGNVLSIAGYGVGGDPVAAGEDKVARRERRYDARNNLIEERYFGIDGKPARQKDGYAHLVMEYDKRDNLARQTFIGLDGQPVTNRIGIATILTTFDALSSRIEERYLGLDGKPVPDRDGVARIEQRYDARGNMTGQSFFDVEGKLTKGTMGFARSEVVHDPAGRIIDFKSFGPDGKPSLVADGYAHQVMRYDAAGHLLELQHFDGSDRQCQIKSGWSRMLTRYDRNGRKVEEAVFGVDGAPTRGPGRYARMTTVYDEAGNPIEQAYWDEHGEPTLSFEGLAKAIFHYDARGNHLETSCLGIDGKLIVGKSRYARMVKKRDEAGRLTEQATFGVDGKLMLSTEGYARKALKYDTAGNMIEEAYFGPEGQPVASRPNGIARVSISYNSAGQTSAIRRFGVNGEKLRHKELPYEELATYFPNGINAEYRVFRLDPSNIPNVAGIDASSRSLFKYNEQGSCLSKEVFHYYGPEQRGKGTAILERQIYNSAGIRIGSEYFDEKERLAIGPTGSAREEIVLDEYGQILRATAFDEKGQRAKLLHLNGLEVLCNRVDFKYDRLGRVIESLFFDSDDKPLVSVDGPCRVTREYGSGGKPIQETTYFSLPKNTQRTALGSPPVRKINRLNDKGEIKDTLVYREVSGSVEGGDMVYSITRLVSPGNPVEVWYEDVKESLLVGPPGYARITQTFDRRKQPLSTRFYGLRGLMIYPKLGVAGIDVKRDRNGREIETRRIGIDEQLVEDAEGVAITRRKWDTKGRMTEEAYFNRLDQPCRRMSVEFAIIRTSYDDAANTSEQRYFDEAGNEIKSLLGVFRKMAKADDQGRLIEERFFNRDGKPMRSTQGVAGLLKKFATGSKPIEIVCVDEDGKPCKSSFGYSKQRFELDTNGNVLAEEYFDENDQPSLIAPGGHYRLETRYDQANRPQIRTYLFATPEKPKGAKGYAKAVETLDVNGNVIEVKHLDSRDQLVVNSDGYAVVRKKYDSRGRLIEEAAFNIDSEPCLFKGGYHRSEQRYDGDRVVMIGHFDEKGQLVVSSVQGYAMYERLTSTDVARPTWRIVDASGEPADCEVVIERVLPGSQAADVGLMPEDVILSYDGLAISHHQQIIELAVSGGEEARIIDYLRESTVQTVSVNRGRLGAVLRVRPKMH